MCLRLNFQIPKYLEIENSRSKPIFQWDTACFRILQWPSYSSFLRKCHFCPRNENVCSVTDPPSIALFVWQCSVCRARAHAAQVSNARGWTIKQSCLFSLHLHADVKGPAVTVKASLAQGISLGNTWPVGLLFSSVLDDSMYISNDFKNIFCNRNNSVQVTDHMNPVLKEGDMKHICPLNCTKLRRSHSEMMLQVCFRHENFSALLDCMILIPVVSFMLSSLHLGWSVSDLNLKKLLRSAHIACNWLDKILPLEPVC